MIDDIWVLLREMASINDATLFFWFLSRTNTDREVDASRTEINEQVFGSRASTTSNIVAIIDRLCALGLVERVPRPAGQTSRYRVLVTTRTEVKKWQQTGPRA